MYTELLLKRRQAPRIILLLLAVFVGAAFETLGAACYQDVTPEEAKTRIGTVSGLILIDVREESEYCDEDSVSPPPGHIAGALNIPWSSGVFQAEYESLPLDAPILIVCRSGGRGGQAANFLCQRGYTDVSNIAGGMLAWSWETVLCEQGFLRGDTNLDKAVDIADAVSVLAYLFDDGGPLTCEDAADANDDGAVDISDAIKILGYLFANDGDLPAPAGECGPDPTEDVLVCAAGTPCE